MKHPQTCEPRRCPRGSGVTQLILLTTSGRCTHERGQRGQGAWTVPTGAPPALSPHCRGHCSQVLRARGHSRDSIPAAGTASLVPGAACQGRHLHCCCHTPGLPRFLQIPINFSGLF